MTLGMQTLESRRWWEDRAGGKLRTVVVGNEHCKEMGIRSFLIETQS